LRPTSGDDTPNVLNVGKNLTAFWDEDAAELEREECSGGPLHARVVIDAFGREQSAPHPGGMRLRKRPRHVREY
jgi:hypothetical protein